MNEAPPKFGRAEIEAAHAAYVRLTGLALKMDYTRLDAWASWLRAGFTIADLTRVVAAIKDGIRRGKRYPGALKFSNLIGKPSKFEEDLALLAPVRQREAVQTVEHVALVAGDSAIARQMERDPVATAEPLQVDREALRDAFRQMRGKKAPSDE